MKRKSKQPLNLCGSQSEALPGGSVVNNFQHRVQEPRKQIPYHSFQKRVGIKRKNGNREIQKASYKPKGKIIISSNNPNRHVSIRPPCRTTRWTDALFIRRREREREAFEESPVVSGSWLFLSQRCFLSDRPILSFQRSDLSQVPYLTFLPPKGTNKK